MTNELLKLVANSPAGVTAVGSGDLLGIIVRTFLTHFVFWLIFIIIFCR
jgi:hypothetical protein